MCKIPCVFQMTSKNADMLAEPKKIWTTSLMGPTEKSPYCPVIFIFSSSSSPLPLSNTLITFSFSFFSFSADMKCIYPLGLGEGSCHRVKCLGKCSVPCQKRRNSRGVCVCVTCVASEAKDMSPTYVVYVVSIG